MTTVTTDHVSTSHAPAGPFERVWAVVKLNLANPWTTIILPWMILGFIFVINYAIWLIIYNAIDGSDRADAAEGFGYSGASLYIFVYMLVVAVQSMNLTFAFALGYGVTRRDFYLGTALTFVLLSAMYAIGMGILAVVEEVTNGWGVNGRMFTAIYFGDGPWFERIWIFFVAFLFFFFVGAVAGSIYVRWKSNGIVAFFAGLAVLLVGVAALFTLTNSWPTFAQFFVTWGFLGSFSWSLVLTAIAGVAGFFVLRRATPKS
jgi:hypothetical protein